MVRTRTLSFAAIALCNVALRVRRQAALSAILLLVTAPVAAQSSGSFKVAYFNIQSGKGEPALPGRASTFVDTINCTDPSRPLNAWGVDVVQRELRALIARDTAIIALGLGEAWFCGSPANVARTLGWTAVSSERNGVALVARHGFSGPEQWQQLDTSLNPNPADTMWVLRRPVCVDALCTASVSVAVAHWYSPEGPWQATTYDRQGEQTVSFLSQAQGQAHVLIGDLNVWESAAASICGQRPIAAGLNRLRAAGYTDAWPYLHGAADGFTGMTNRSTCGTPEGAAWKRIDYAWSMGYRPLSMTRFGVVPAGEEAPSDHYGIITEYARSEVPDPGVGTLGPGDALIYAAAATITGDWRVIEDSTAASGRALENPDRGAAKRLIALADPPHFFQATFSAVRDRPYRVWLRGRAAANAWTNDSVFVQFSGAVSAGGEPVWRIGSTDATVISVEQCSGCGLAGWGWADNGYGTAGPLVYFANSGAQSLRVQSREDGIIVDQILLSPQKYLDTPPGDPKNDATIFRLPAATAEIVRYAADATVAGRDWVRVGDASAAAGTALSNPDRAAAKLLAPLASPGSYVEVTFNAEARRGYRLWLRGRAEGNAWSNDSVYVQFSGSVTDAGVPTWRIGTTAGTWVSIEDCSGCGLSGWGWQDNAYGAGALGPLVYFETSGTQTLRIQQREDGIVLDQIVLSPERYLTVSPGATKNDGTILVR